MALSYQQLWDGTKAFSSPNAAIAVSGTDLMSYENCVVTGLEVSLTNRDAAGMAIVSLEAEPEDTKLTKLLVSGAPTEVSLGYGSDLKLLFKGYVHQSLAERSEGEKSYRIVCLDVKGLMAQGSYLRSEDGKTPTQVIDGILGKARYKALYKNKHVGVPPSAFSGAFVQDGASDLAFLRGWAARLGYRFFVQGDTLVYNKSAPKTETLKLDYGNGIISSTAKTDLTEQAAKTLVLGFDPDGKRLSASASADAPPLSADVRVYREPDFAKKEQLDCLAKAYMEAVSGEYSTVRASCVGIPELIPMNRVSVSGETWEISEAVHTFDDGGYKVRIEGRVL